MSPNPITRAGRAVADSALYTLTIPERFVRSLTGFFGGIVKETTELVMPGMIKHTNTYNLFVGNLLRFAVENVGGVEGAYADDSGMGDDYAVRKTVGNVIEGIGLATIHVSPLWIFAFLSDGVSGGKAYLARLHAELKERGLVDEDTDPGSLHSILEGVERSSASFAKNIDAPPLSRKEIMENLRDMADSIKDIGSRTGRAAGKSADDMGAMMRDFMDTAKREKQSLLGLSGVMALQATERAKRTTAKAMAVPKVAGDIVYENIFCYYRDTLSDIHSQGYGAVAAATFAPYRKALTSNFERDRLTLTEQAFRGSASGLRWLVTGKWVRAAKAEDAPPAEGQPNVKAK